MKESQSAPTLEYEQATSYRRFIARLIDLASAWLVASLLGGIVLTLLSPMLKSLTVDSKTSGGLYLVWSLIFLLTYDTLLIRTSGQTVGMRLLGMRVVDVEGNRLGWGMSLARAVMVYLIGLVVAALTFATASLFGWIFVIGLGRVQRFPHDQLTKSFVVREVRGQLKVAVNEERVAAKEEKPAGQATPLAELERLQAEGIISAQELARKKQEMTAPGGAAAFKETLSTPEGEYELATTDRRTWARVIDFYLIGLVAFLPLVVLLTRPLAAAFRNENASAFAVLGLMLLFALAYDAILTRLSGKTVGKMVVGIRVVDAQAHRPRWGRSILRAVLVPIGAILVMFVAFITQRRIRGKAGIRLLHDEWCGTFVIREAHGQLKKMDKQTPIGKAT